ncbi:MAG: translation initiation factor IF-3 [Candidatus Pacebacteria bacterium]|nr:translation initiation factor IF-3 [Candidatus Paceibacterota bacterium]
MRIKWRKAKPKEQKPYFISNQHIRAEKVFLIDENGENVGVTDRDKALALAEEMDLDLVLVNPKAEPPVAKIVDLGQMKYEQEKKAHKQRMQQKKVEVKAIRLSVRISSHDFDFRLRQAEKFLSQGNKLKIELNLKGRERQHPAQAREVVSNFVEKIKENQDLNLIIEQPLTKQGGRFTILLANKN